jgi:hypothetical protein
MKRRARPLPLVLPLLLGHGVAGAQSGPPEALLGGVEAVLFVCGPIDAKTAKDGAEMVARLVQQHKVDLTAVRRLQAYSSTYNAEANRLLALPPAKKIEACKNVF